MTVMERIKAELEAHPVVLFMKGMPELPMCGYSQRAVAALREIGRASCRERV